MICASTGNTAASAAAYAARAGLRGAVIVPEGKIAIGKLAQALMHGARVIALRGNFDEALRIVRELADKHPIELVNSVNPLPDRGPEDGRLRGRRGARRGARRAGDPGRQRRQRHRLLARLPGAARRRPVLYGFQAEGAAPLVRARRSPNPETVASAIRIGNPARWEEAMAAFTASRGRVAAVSDEQILDAYRWLAASEGVFCEPASAASVAGLLAHGLPVAEGAAAAGAVVCVLTGHGLKDPDTALAKAPPVINCENDLERGRARGVRLMTSRRRLVRVPASSANLGPGYDAMAAAVSLHLELEVEEAGEFSFDPGGAEVPTGRDNLIVRAFESLHPADGIAFRLRSEIPLARGLGSSAAAIVAGLFAADHIFELALSREEMLARATGSRATPTTSPRRSTAALSSADAGEAARRSRPASTRPRGSRRGRDPARGGLDRAWPAPRSRPRCRSPTRSPTSPPPPGSCSGLQQRRPRPDRARPRRPHPPAARRDLYPRSMELVDSAAELGALGATISGAGPTVLVWTTWQDAGKVAEALEQRCAGWAEVRRAAVQPAWARTSPSCSRGWV